MNESSKGEKLTREANTLLLSKIVKRPIIATKAPLNKNTDANCALILPA
jgi:hypothetical protein